MLHGDIKVNDKPIGHWSARRLRRFPAEVNEYECEVEINGWSREFHVSHRFSNGALALVTKVLVQADMELRTG
jgi:hypothetical protein